MSVVIRHLSVSYLPGSPVLGGIDLEVAKGEWLCLLGPNGAGKSTLLKAIAGLVEHTGSIELQGVDARLVSKRDRARSIAFVPQEPVFPVGMTVYEYVLLGRTPHLPYFGTEGRLDLQAGWAALDLLRLRRLADRNLSEISGGERRRAVLARAIAQEADILLLDEPTSALDIGQGQNALELIGHLRKQRAVTIITAMHDLTLAGQFADRLLMISGGRIVAAGAPVQVLTTDYIRDFYQANVEVVTVNDDLAIVPVRNGSR